MKFLLSIFTVLITTFSCKSTKDVAEKSTAMQDSIFGTYSISKLVNQDILSTNLSITFEEGTNRVSGRSGCNNFFGWSRTRNPVIWYGWIKFELSERNGILVNNFVFSATFIVASNIRKVNNG